MATNTCPVCGVRFEREQSKSLPFCSERCRMIDLKRWLGEEYSMPAKESDPDEENRAPDDDSAE
jgi:endogenous inhibitor of DNA gyrase (YacG/DUF329 family)